MNKTRLSKKIGTSSPVLQYQFTKMINLLFIYVEQCIYYSFYQNNLFKKKAFLHDLSSNARDTFLTFAYEILVQNVSFIHMMQHLL